MKQNTTQTISDKWKVIGFFSTPILAGAVAITALVDLTLWFRVFSALLILDVFLVVVALILNKAFFKTFLLYWLAGVGVVILGLIPLTIFEGKLYGAWGYVFIGLVIAFFVVYAFIVYLSFLIQRQLNKYLVGVGVIGAVIGTYFIVPYIS